MRSLKKFKIKKLRVNKLRVNKFYFKLFYFKIFLFFFRLGIFDKKYFSYFDISYFKIRNCKQFYFNIYIFFLKNNNNLFLEKILHLCYYFFKKNIIYYYIFEYNNITKKFRNFSSKFFFKFKQKINKIIPYSNFEFKMPIFSFFALSIYMEYIRSFYYTNYINNLYLIKSGHYLLKKQLNIYTFNYKKNLQNLHVMLRYNMYFLYTKTEFIVFRSYINPVY
jgi:hypothetical protein